MIVYSVGQNHTVGQHGFEYRSIGVALRAESVARISKGDSRYRADRSGVRAVRGGKFFARINTDLIYLFACLSAFVGQQVLYFESAARDFHVGEAVSLSVLRYFKHLGGEIITVFRHERKSVKA